MYHNKFSYDTKSTATLNWMEVTGIVCLFKGIIKKFNVLWNNFTAYWQIDQLFDPANPSITCTFKGKKK